MENELPLTGYWRWVGTFSLKRSKAQYAQPTLYPIIGRLLRLNIKSKLILIRFFILPMKTYASIACGPFCKTNILKHQRQENLSMRCAHGYISNEEVSGIWDIHQSHLQRRLGCRKFWGNWELTLIPNASTGTKTLWTNWFNQCL